MLIVSSNRNYAIFWIWNITCFHFEDMLRIEEFHPRFLGRVVRTPVAAGGVWGRHNPWQLHSKFGLSWIRTNGSDHLGPAVNHFKIFRIFNIYQFNTAPGCLNFWATILRCHFYLKNLNFKWLIIPRIFPRIAQEIFPRKCGPISADKLTDNLSTESSPQDLDKKSGEILARLTSSDNWPQVQTMQQHSDIWSLF